MEKERKFLHGFIKYTKDGKIVPGSLIITRNRPKDGVWEEVVIDLCCDDFPDSTNQGKKAFVKFDSKGRIVPGSLIMGKHLPKPGIWKEVSVNVCCTTTTTAAPSICPPNMYFSNEVVGGSGNSVIFGMENADGSSLLIFNPDYTTLFVGENITYTANGNTNPGNLRLVVRADWTIPINLHIYSNCQLILCETIPPDPTDLDYIALFTLPITGDVNQQITVILDNVPCV